MSNLLKRCTRCGQEKPRAAFNKEAQNKDGLQGRCRDCAHVVYREWYQANIDKARAYSREYAARNKAVVRQRWKDWYKNNPDKALENMRRRRARLANATVVLFTPEQLTARMAYWGNKCWMCGGAFEHVDHVKPLSKGGPHILANLRPACEFCNCSKHDCWEAA